MTVETPQPRDRVRWQRTRAIEGVVEEITSDGLNIRAEDGRLHLCQVEDATVEVLERADDPSKSLRGEIREIDGMAAVCYGKDMWVYFSALHHGATGGYGVHKDEQMIGAPVIGVVPRSPAAEEFVPDWERELIEQESSARREVRVSNEPHGPSPTVRILMANRIAEGRAVEAVGIAHDAGMDWHAARVYVESMSEYQTYLSEHGRTEVDPAEADRMRAMGFDKQPEVQISDEDRALIASVLEERMGEYFRDTGYGYRLNTDHLAGVVADIVYAVRVQDRKRGDR